MSDPARAIESEGIDLRVNERGVKKTARAPKFKIKA
jgi:hypothetical protein